MITRHLTLMLLAALALSFLAAELGPLSTPVQEVSAQEADTPAEEGVEVVDDPSMAAEESDFSSPEGQAAAAEPPSQGQMTPAEPPSPEAAATPAPTSAPAPTAAPQATLAPPAIPTPQSTSAAPRATPSPTSSVPTWTKSGYTIPAPKSLSPVFEYLEQKAYTWVLTNLSRRRTQVDFVQTDRYWGVYVPSYNAVLINERLRSASKEALAALLIHEGTHVTDDIGGRLNSFNECVSSERNAMEQAAQFWRNLYGGTGKQPPADSFEGEMNFLVQIYPTYRVQFEDYLKSTYTTQCSLVGS